MTVIAYRNGVLAADKLSHANGLRGTVTKIFRVGDAMVGVCGALTMALEVVAWLRAGGNPKHMPDFQKTDEHQNIILIKDKRIWLYERGVVPLLMEDEYCSIGAGSEIATAAMWCGKDAVEAVQCAIALNTSCGQGVDFLLAEDKPIKKRKKA